MGSPKMLGMTRASLSNRRADMRRSKAWKRNREYTDKHQAALEKSRAKKEKIQKFTEE